MKFVFFSPFAKTSAIGRVTALIVRACSELGHTTVVVRTERETLLRAPAHACKVEAIAWTDADAVNAAVQGADALVYQIGNNYAYHCGGLHWLAKLPGIVCLHDFLLAHLFAEWAEGRQAQAASILTEWYGEHAAADFFKAHTPEGFIDMASRYAMTEWICSMAQGVVSHSHWGMPRVAQSCPGPLRVLPLPYDAPSRGTATADAKHKDGLVHILTIGHVNPNKRIESVIRAIGSSAVLRDRVSYRLCGLGEALVSMALATLARTLDVDLVISGEVDDVALQGAMNNADIVCCLRWPSFEAASATAIEGLLYGKAVVVTDAAFYSELPDDCVRKISPNNEVEELRIVLEQLCGDAGERRRMALKGQEWATATFSAAKYVEELADLAPRVAAAKSSIAMVQEVVSTLSAWGASLALISAEEIAGPLELFEDRGGTRTGAVAT